MELVFYRYHGSYLALYEIIFCLGKSLIRGGSLFVSDRYYHKFVSLCHCMTLEQLT
jgi:hypothetical protein